MCNPTKGSSSLYANPILIIGSVPKYGFVSGKFIACPIHNSLCNPPVFLVSCSRPEWRLPAVLDDVLA
jgi:hypothetical protein